MWGQRPGQLEADHAAVALRELLCACVEPLDGRPLDEERRADELEFRDPLLDDDLAGVRGKLRDDLVGVAIPAVGQRLRNRLAEPHLIPGSLRAAKGRDLRVVANDRREHERLLVEGAQGQLDRPVELLEESDELLVAWLEHLGDDLVLGAEDGAESKGKDKAKGVAEGVKEKVGRSNGKRSDDD